MRLQLYGVESMKKLLTLFFAVLLTLYFAETQVSAQTKEREFVTVELIIKKENLKEKIKIPISENPFSKDGKTLNENEFFMGGMSRMGCEDCFLTSNYKTFAFAELLNQNSPKIGISINFLNKEKCNVEKTFFVKRGRNTELNLKCGVKIKANY